MNEMKQVMSTIIKEDPSIKGIIEGHIKDVHFKETPIVKQVFEQSKDEKVKRLIDKMLAPTESEEPEESEMSEVKPKKKKAAKKKPKKKTKKEETEDTDASEYVIMDEEPKEYIETYENNVKTPEKAYNRNKVKEELTKADLEKFFSEEKEKMMQQKMNDMFNVY